MSDYDFIAPGVRVPVRRVYVPRRRRWTVGGVIYEIARGIMEAVALVAFVAMIAALAISVTAATLVH